MIRQTPRAELLARLDGIGSRRVEDDDPSFGRVEILDLNEKLASPAAEQAISTRASRMNALAGRAVAKVHRVSRDEHGLHVVEAVTDGVPVSAVLGALETGRLMLADEAILDIAAAVVRSVTALHEVPGGLAHGALTPAHVVLTREGRASLTGGSVAPALEALQVNRDHHWRDFRLALPPAASFPRFDQRADVTQIGALVLSLALRRSLGADDLPRSMGDLVVAATDGKSLAPLRTWLQQALQLHPRGNFGSAPEAGRVLVGVISGAIGRHAGVQSVQTMVGLMCGDPPSRPRPLVRVQPPAPMMPKPLPPVPRMAAEPASSPLDFLRAVLPKLRTT